MDNKITDPDIFGFGRRLPERDMSDEAVKRTLREWIKNTNKVVYTSIVNNNSNVNANAYVALYISLNGEIINISRMAAQITGLKCKRRLTHYVYVKKGQEIGKAVVKELQSALYDGLYVKERLEQQWV